jgi:hypothetical protein
MLRTPKSTNKNKDDFKVLMVGMVLTLCIFAGSLIQPRLSEYRWYRDLTKLTPFYNVEVEYSRLDGPDIYVGGALTKRRCTYNYLIAYAVDKRGVGYKIFLDDSIEKLPGHIENRPPSKRPQNWGPWKLSTLGTLDDPKEWEIFVEHKQCPSEPHTQRNKFASGKWKNYNNSNDKNSIWRFIDEIYLLVTK